ncbi:hypothetical protein CO038_02235 [Candidatus Pacearchaeota archaeon CG_4_9_14_0_2_um_filter_39_13]|nr:helix-turn-helix domain-containing protein [Candidatus Pacearchaeota archaeon]OIO43913.1 MAG: hypothetical protein AUJ64_01285 [Candidatus Pacearchaeota archaeon CG1_02_39_14]PJC44764.1 MAG: hypothetical protein CO038_02235 [Candidatus Pacearchaeota archaeon CG_4_9_14_0_2_um_filter_39_13]
MKIVEAIKEGEIVRVSEEQARAEELFVLRNVPEVVNKDVETSLRPQKTLDLTRFSEPKRDRFDVWRKAAYKKNNVAKELKDNFHWEILKKRRGLGMSRKQFADKLGETEERLKVIENGGLPEDNFALVIKIEKALNIVLRKENSIGNVNLAELQKAEEGRKEKSRVQEAIERVRRDGKQEEDKADIFGDEIEVID